jgi:hypothetical protein
MLSLDVRYGIYGLSAYRRSLAGELLRLADLTAVERMALGLASSRKSLQIGL